MLAALRPGAIVLGVAAGGLVASLVALALGGLLTVLEVDEGADVGLVVGIVLGLAAGGWVSGKRALHSHRFHGQVSGLLLAFLIVIVARLGGSPASTTTILWLALISIVVSGVGGWVAGRTTPPEP
jgi:putative membrane protein (TIGR04086 family)